MIKVLGAYNYRKKETLTFAYDENEFNTHVFANTHLTRQQVKNVSLFRKLLSLARYESLKILHVIQ